MNDFIERVSTAVWGMPLIILFLAGGLVISKAAGFVQFRFFGRAMKAAFGGIFLRSKDKKGGISPFEAVCTALAGTVGTGNIVGTAAAIAYGGPGAIFWMWVSAFIGMGTKYAEILLAVKFRERDWDGGYRGGPMYYIKNGLSKGYCPLAVLFSLFGTLAAFGIGNAVQMGSIFAAVSEATGLFDPVFAGSFSLKVITGAVASAALLYTAMSGNKGRYRGAAFLVPVMAVMYALGALAVIIKNFSAVPTVLGEIVRCAFDSRAVFGGTTGAAISCGLRRGLLSNEAGLGSSPMAHGSADTKSPTEEGLLGIFEVFCDTIVICTLTALMLLCSGVGVSENGTVGCAAALSQIFGVKAAVFFLGVSITLFAFSSVMSWSLYGEKCVVYLMGKGAEAPYRLLFAAVVFLSPLIDFSLVIGIADILNGLMAVPNMIALLLLLPVVKKETEKLKE